MWENQDLFRITAQIAARSLFDELDERLTPSVFLLGIRIQELETQPLTWLEIELPKIGQTAPNFTLEEFKSVPVLAEQLRINSSGRHYFRSNPASHQRHLEDLTAEAYREAIRTVIAGKQNLRSKVSFISQPVPVGNYWVFTVLEIEKIPFESYATLIKTHVEDYWPISRSLLESTADLFLARCSANMELPDRGRDLLTHFINRDELLRRAGEHFTSALSLITHSLDGGSLFESLNIISSLRYEGDASFGQLIIAEARHPNVTLQVELINPVPLSEYRKIRKLLQTVDENASIISNGTQVLGLGNLTGHYNPQTESIFTIQFVDHYHWLLTHNNQPLMRCKYGVPNLVKENVDPVKFADLCNRFFGQVAYQANRLLATIKSATRQKHGALVVVTATAETEVERLQYQSFRIQPVELTDQNVHSFTSIDGAVIVDPMGYCHALGVILDGPATSKGDSSRGSRYNSAVRYVEFRKSTEPCIVIVVSEDGMVDLIPNLMPRIYRAMLDEHLDQFARLAEQEHPDRRQFYGLYEFFENHAFYLSAQVKRI